MAPCLLWMLFSLRGGCAGGNIGITVPGRDEKGRWAPLFATVRDQPVLRMPAAMPAMVTISA